MPCNDGRPIYETPPDVRAKLDKYARMLCGLCRRVTAKGATRLISDDSELKEWWGKHQAEDARREAKEKAEVAKEKLIGQALGKLTFLEKRALGLTDK